VSKTAASVLAFVSFILFSIPMAAQFKGLLPNGNVYAGVSYGQLTDVINKQSYRGFEGTIELFPLSRFPKFGFILDGSGYYRRGSTPVTQYVFLGGPRITFSYGKWSPFVQALGGIRHINSDGFVYNPISIDVGGGTDYKLRFKKLSWRFQADYLYGHYATARQSDYRASTGPVWRF
jgi:hypothetical protein